MNKFRIIKCMDVKENGYNGTCVVMSCLSNPSFLLFFPVSKENAKIINYVLKDKTDYDINTNVIGIYRTMIDSWEAGDRFLSGIIMDTAYSEESKDEIIMIQFALVDQDGRMDSLVYVNFLHAVLLSCLEKIDVIVSDKLLSKMMPDSEDQENESKKVNNSHNFPEDKKIVDIAKKIMNGKIKDKK